MDYDQFRSILERHTIDEGRQALLEAISVSPHRFVGVFRPTTPRAKVLQFLLQSQEIRMGGALESVIRAVLEDHGCVFSSAPLIGQEQEKLRPDLHFSMAGVVHLVELKVRDDHDSSKKRGQVQNLRNKIGTIRANTRDKLVIAMYFIDPGVKKNQAYYRQELRQISHEYDVATHLFYGHELFDFLGCLPLWQQLVDLLSQWRRDLPDFPEIDFDLHSDDSLATVRGMNITHWRRIVENDALWNEGVMRALFSTGTTLRRFASLLDMQPDLQSRKISSALSARLARHDW